MQDKSARSREDALRAPTLRYLEGLRTRRRALTKLQVLCEQNALSAENRDELISHAHKLAGTGATFGFNDISRLGKRLEKRLVEHPDIETRTLILHTHALIDACTAAVNAGFSEVAAHPARNIPEAKLPARPLPVLLVVDDDESVRDIMLDLFKADAQVIVGADAKEGLALMRKHRPDLVLLDDSLPGGISGLQMLEDIQSMAELSKIPIVMITASRQPEEVMRGLMAGASDYIVKPFEPKSLARVVRARLERQGNTILIADDDGAVRELLEHKFSAAGCKVASAADGARAWAMLQDQEFALVVLDRMMPGYDGMTVLRMMRLNQKLSSTPVVFLTARHYGADVLDGLNTGAADYIVKPFDPDEVVARCVRLLDRKEA